MRRNFRLNRKIILYSLLLVSAVFGLCSCLTTARKDNYPYIWLTNNTKYILLSPDNIEKPLDGFQRISASFDGQFYQMNTWVKADETGIDMTLLNEMGANMGELSFRGSDISFSSAVFPSSMRPEYIVADFQFCFYSIDALTEALKKSGLLITETGDKRQIFQGNSIIIEITKDNNSVIINNHLRGYSYTLEGDF